MVAYIKSLDKNPASSRALWIQGFGAHTRTLQGILRLRA